MMGNKEIVTKEEFIARLSVAIIDLDGYVSSLKLFDEQIQEPKLTLNLMLQARNYDDGSREVVNSCFDKFNGIKKVLSAIEKKRDAIKTRFQLSYFKKFYIDSHQFNQKVIELNDAIKRCKEKIDAQIIRCIEYFNERDIEISL